MKLRDCETEEEEGEEDTAEEAKGMKGGETSKEAWLKEKEKEERKEVDKGRREGIEQLNYSTHLFFPPDE